MNSFCRIAACAVFAALLSARAQTPPDSPVVSSASSTSAEEEVLTLNPFVVDASVDKGYRAMSTLAGTRLNTPVKDVGASISIYTKDFLADIGATNATELLVYATGMEAAGAAGNFSGATGDINGDQLNPNSSRINPQQSRTRGLASPTYTRGFFTTRIPMDAYNTETVTVNRGPNAILFGVGSPAGVVESTLAQANTRRDFGKVEVRYGNNDSLRTSLDVNRVLADDKLALRLALLQDDERYNQRPAFEEERRIYGALMFTPTRSTSLRVNYETGDIRANRPISTLPYKSISDPWFAAGRPSVDWRFFDDPALNPDAATQPTNPGLLISQNNIFDNVVIPYTNPTDTGPVTGFRSRIPGTGGTAANSYLVNTFHPDINRDAANDEIQFYNTWNIHHLPGAYWTGANVLPGQQPGFVPAGIKFQGFTDFDAFDFKNRLLDETSRQFSDFRAITAAVEQRFWEDRIGVELAYDAQRESSNARNSFFSTNNVNHIRIDVNDTLANGQPNPNVGRPYVTYGQSNWDNGKSDRDTIRATGYLRYDFEDLNESAGRWLGRHTLTALYERNNTESIYYGTRLALDGEAARAMNPNLQGFERRPGVVVYMGPSIIGNNNPLTLEPIAITPLAPGPTADITMFYRNGNATDLGAFRTSPASLVEINNGGSASREVIESKAFVLQSDWIHHLLVTTVGWRRDTDFFASRGIGFVSNPADRNDPGQVHYSFDDLTFERTPPFNVAAEIVSYSAVLRWPHQWVRLPEGTDLSLFYNKSENFTPAGGRINAYGESLSSPQGNTEEYGLNLSLLNDRLSLRLNRFETSVTGQSSTPTVFAEATFNAIPQIASFWALEGNRNPENVAFMNAAIEKLFSPLPANFRELYQYEVLGTAPNITSTVQGLAGRSDTTDFTAKGWEAEIVFNPTPNWRILANIAKQETTQTNAQPGLKDLISRMAPIWEELADIPRSGYPLGTGPDNPPPANVQRLGEWIDSTILVPYATVLAAEGSVSAEQRKWRANLVTNYSFDGGLFGGRLKGWSIGGAVRWQDKLAMGYPTTRNPDGSVVIDVDNPYWAPAETNVDAWIGYQRSIFNGRIDWSLKFNVRNLVGDDGTIPITVQPWGEVATSRLSPERRWYLTNTFEF